MQQRCYFDYCKAQKLKRESLCLWCEEESHAKGKSAGANGGKKKKANPALCASAKLIKIENRLL